MAKLSDYSKDRRLEAVWQKSLQYCKVISLQLIKINGKKKKEQLKDKPGVQ